MMNKVRLLKQKEFMLKYEDIKIGSVYSFNKVISKEDVIKFAELSGDFNPLHVDEEFGKNSQFKKNIVHGMLAASFFSTLIGMYCPGEKALYLSQTLNFRQPLFYGDNIKVCGTVTAKYDSLKMIQLKTEIFREEAVIISGEAKVKVLA